MDKPFLVFKGEDHEERGGWDDLAERFETDGAALDFVESLESWEWAHIVDVRDGLVIWDSTDHVYTLAELEARETISSGQFDNLKIDDGTVRVWLSRCGVADGLKYDNGVTVEVLKDGRWVTARQYEAV